MKASTIPIHHIILAVGLLSTSIQVGAQEVLSTDSKLESVTIYSNGASMHHNTLPTSIPKGNSELVINQIARNVNPESIRILSSDEAVQIHSVSFERDYIISDKNKSSSYLALKKQYDKELQVLNSKTNARISEQSTLSMLEANKQIGGTSGATQASITSMLDFYRKEHKKLSDAISKLYKEEKEQKEIVDKLKEQLEESGGENTNAGQIVITLYSDKATQTAFTVDYYTYNVSWNPSYEIRMDDIEKPMNLVYSANLSQNTGVDWENVSLIFSDANPNINNDLPYINTWWLSYEDMRPNPPAPRLSKLQSNVLYDQVVEESASGALMQRSTVNSSQLQTSFVINTPYNVYTNKKPLTIELQSYKLPASYTYYSVPSMQEAAFLVAKVADWEQYNLLPGQAQLIIDKQYSGKSYINPVTTLDTLEISLGQDQRIITKRKRIDEKGSKTSFLGSTQKRSYTYEIELKNTRKEAAAIEVKELIPVSTEKDIVVKLEESSSAKVDEDKGELTWKVDLKPNETKKLILRYTITSAKGKRLIGL